MRIIPLSNEANFSGELIVLAAPPETDGYYDELQDQIIDFHLDYAQSVHKNDAVLILSGPKHYDRYVKALGPERVALMPQQDIWMRDFSPLYPANPVLMRYSTTAQGGGRLGQKEADFVQKKFIQSLKSVNLSFPRSNLLNDGGNFVVDEAGNAVLSRKFLRDNQLTEAEGRAAIMDVTGVRHVAFIEADEQGGLEHADGVVAFVADNVLAINSYPEDPDYAQSLKSDLRRGLPSVTIHEITTPYNGSVIYDARFGSACGLYTNMLVTRDRIYLPQFGIPDDALALKQVRQWTDKDVIPVQSKTVCQMGGGVRCMSWQVRGDAAAAVMRLAKVGAE